MKDRSNSLRKAQGAIAGGARFDQSAFSGWLYSSLIDRAFIDTELPAIRSDPGAGRNWGNVKRLVMPTSETSRDALDTVAFYQHLKEQLTDAGFAQDSFVGSGSAIGQVFAKDATNILVIGAGCTGLALANALQSSFGSRVRVLVVENRIIERHFKQPYSRDWLTFIRLDLLQGLLDPGVLKTLTRVGDRGFMGVPLCLFETILLQSCKNLGVRFLFDHIDDYPALLRLGVDLVFDATGGRLLPPETTAETPGPTFTERHLEGYGDAYRRFGITTSVTDRKADVETIRRGTALFPAFSGRPLKLACFKLTNVPIRLYQPLLDFVRGKNDDSRFYIWPGILKPEINSLLLIINLHKPEYEAAAVMANSTPLREMLTRSEVMHRLHRDVVGLMELVSAKTNADEVKVEPPFVFSPYLRPYQPNEQFYGKPLIRVGDSIFNGNPKTGNGLSRHLAHLGYVRNCLAECL